MKNFVNKMILKYTADFPYPNLPRQGQGERLVTSSPGLNPVTPHFIGNFSA